MLYSLFQSILLSAIFPYIATAFMTGRTLDRRLPLPLTLLAWVCVLIGSYATCYLLVDDMIRIVYDPRMGLIMPGDVEKAAMVCNLTLLAFNMIATMCLYRGKISSRLLVSLLYSSICITSYMGIDTLLAYTDLNVLSGEYLRNSALHLGATVAVYAPLCVILPGRIKRMLVATDGRVGRYIPAPIVMFSAFIVDDSLIIYGGVDSTQGLIVDCMIVTFSVLCLYLILTKLDSEIRVDGYRKDLDAARLIQESCLPNREVLESVENAEVDAFILPAKEVGGDFYDVVTLDGGRCAFIVADVSGKGVPASLFAMRAKTLVSERLRDGDDIPGCLESVNRSLMEGNKGCMYVTLSLCILCPDGTVTCSSAGHPPPLIRRDGNVSMAEAAGGRMLGVLPSKYGQWTTRLGPGDTLLMYTDGATDAEDRSGTQFGMKRLMEAFSASGESPCEKVSSAITGFSKGVDQADDLTLMSITRRP